MATYFVSTSGSNTSPYDTWAKAATSLQTALTAATAVNDVVVVQSNVNYTLAADTTFTTSNSIYIIAASADDANTAYTPTPMGASNWIGNDTTNYFVRFDGGADDVIYVYGLTFRTAGSTADNIRLGTIAGASFTWDTCYFWHGNTNTASTNNIVIGGGTDAHELVNCTLRFGATGQGVEAVGSVFFKNCTLSSSGSAPSNLFVSPNNLRSVVDCTGCDFSHCTGNLVGNAGTTSFYRFGRCRLGTGVDPLAQQTSNPTAGSPEVFVFDSSSGDTHTFFGYYNAMGRAVSSTAAYVTAGAAAQSWEIITTSYCTALNPFVGPWIDWHNTGTSSITPYIECLRNNGTATKYSDHQVYAEFSYKNTANSTQASGLVNDGPTIANRIAGSGTAQADGVGTGSWTIASSNSPASFKCGAPSAITPAEVGAIRARIVCSLTSVSGLYVDPQIRT